MRWPPVIPRALENVLAPFTAYKDGWARWYKGRTVHICGRTVPLEDVEDRWADKKREIDGDISEIAKRISGRGAITLREGIGEYCDYLDHRVATGQPKRMSQWTREDYVRTLRIFARAVGPDRDLASIGPAGFATFAKLFGKRAPTTLGRNVANVAAFFRWCEAEEHIATMPRFGRYLVRPDVQTNRDLRLGQRKTFTPAELRTLLEHASLEERAWIGLGINGALDNSDIAHLTLEVLDLDAGLIDYRRRKTGKVRRLIPIHPECAKWLKGYSRPAAADPANDDRVFLTPTGLPLLRIKPNGKEGREARNNPLDYISMKWTRLAQRAGFRPKPVTKRHNGKRILKFPAWAGSADRRGFRGLRTTFANLAPPGYRDEVEIIMGHAAGSVLLENYLETFGMDRLLSRLRGVVDHVWHVAFKEKPQPGAISRVAGSDAGKRAARVSRRVRKDSKQSSPAQRRRGQP